MKTKVMMSALGLVLLSGCDTSGTDSVEVPAVAEAPKYSDEIKNRCQLLTDEQRAMFYRADRTEEETELLNLELGLCHATQAGDFELTWEHAHESLLSLPPGSPILPGKAAFVEMSSIYKRDDYDMAWEPVDAYISSTGDMAWAFGLVTTTDPDSGTQQGKYVSLWKKENDKWYFTADILNYNK